MRQLNMSFRLMMGAIVGKTLQTIAFLAHLKSKGACLSICSTRVISDLPLDVGTISHCLPAFRSA